LAVVEETITAGGIRAAAAQAMADRETVGMVDINLVGN
jgi:hypothetical protein